MRRSTPIAPAANASVAKLPVEWVPPAASVAGMAGVGADGSGGGGGGGGVKPRLGGAAPDARPVVRRSRTVRDERATDIETIERSSQADETSAPARAWPAGVPETAAVDAHAKSAAPGRGASWPVSKGKLSTPRPVVSVDAMPGALVMSGPVAGETGGTGGTGGTGAIAGCGSCSGGSGAWGADGEGRTGCAALCTACTGLCAACAALCAACAALCVVAAAFAAAEARPAPVVCTTPLESPGLATRIAIAMLQLTQTVTPMTDAGGGAASLQLHCQFQTTAVVSSGSGGTLGGRTSLSQFQCQFQTRV